MERWQTEEHEECVEQLLGKLRRAMLGCMAPCLPERVSTRSGQRRAIRTAVERLSLCFALTNAPVSAVALQDCRCRLYAIITYLYFECRRADQTFHSLLQLAELDTDIFTQMVARARHTPCSFAKHYRHTPEVDGNVESAVLRYLAQDDSLPPAHICALAAERALETLRRECGGKILNEHCLSL